VEVKLRLRTGGNEPCRQPDALRFMSKGMDSVICCIQLVKRALPLPHYRISQVTTRLAEREYIRMSSYEPCHVLCLPQHYIHYDTGDLRHARHRYTFVERCCQSRSKCRVVCSIFKISTCQRCSSKAAVLSIIKHPCHDVRTTH
jgi:hypothetical protein